MKKWMKIVGCSLLGFMMTGCTTKTDDGEDIQEEPVHACSTTRSKSDGDIITEIKLYGNSANGKLERAEYIYTVEANGTLKDLSEAEKYEYKHNIAQQINVDTNATELTIDYDNNIITFIAPFKSYEELENWHNTFTSSQINDIYNVIKTEQMFSECDGKKVETESSQNRETNKSTQNETQNQETE